MRESDDRHPLIRPAPGRPRLPNLVIAGVAKAGTTSLFEYLGQHPEVHPARVKQTGFFKDPDSQGNLSVTGYADHFRGAGSAPVVMEATPGYFQGGSTTATRIAGTLGTDVRILISLRDPVQRLRSHHRMLLRAGSLDVDEHRFVDFVAPLLDRTAVGESRVQRLFDIGRYSEHLPGWWQTFDDRVRIVFFDDLERDAEGVVRELCAWLGIDTGPSRDLDYSVRNRSAVYRSAHVARSARFAARTLGPVWQRHPRLKGSLRAAHGVVNTRPASRDEVPDDRRVDERLRALYRPSLELLDAQLRQRATLRVPGWVTSPRTGDDRA